MMATFPTIWVWLLMENAWLEMALDRFSRFVSCPLEYRNACPDPFDVSPTTSSASLRPRASLEMENGTLSTPRLVSVPPENSTARSLYPLLTVALPAASPTELIALARLLVPPGRIPMGVTVYPDGNPPACAVSATPAARPTTARSNDRG